MCLVFRYIHYFNEYFISGQKSRKSIIFPILVYYYTMRTRLFIYTYLYKVTWMKFHTSALSYLFTSNMVPKYYIMGGFLSSINPWHFFRKFLYRPCYCTSPISTGRLSSSVLNPNVKVSQISSLKKKYIEGSLAFFSIFFPRIV